MVFLALVFMTLKNYQQHYLQACCTELRQNKKKNVEILEEIFNGPLSRVWLPHLRYS